MTSGWWVCPTKKYLKLILVIGCIVFSYHGYTQTVLLNEGFETDGEGSRYDSTWNASATAFFEQTPASTFTGLSNVTGSGVLSARQVNNSPGTNPTDPFGIFRTRPINVTGYDNLTLDLDIAAAPGEWNLDFDSLQIFYAFDNDITNAVFTKIGEFRPATNADSDLIEDDDLDGAPGPSTNALSGALTTYTYNIPSTGDNLMIRILLFNTADSEIVVFDELEITGTPILNLVNLTPTNGSTTNDLSSITIEYDQAISAGSSGSITVNGPVSVTKDIVTDITDFDFSTANEVTIDLSGTTFTDGSYSIDIDAGIFQNGSSQPNISVDGSTSWSFTLDVTPPAIPTVSSISDDSGTNTSDGITNDQTLIISGTSDVNSTVTLSETGLGILGSNIPVDGSGNWSFDFTGTTLTAGNYSFFATATDPVGNESAASTNFNVEVDIAPPTAPTISGIADDTGISNSDQITNDQTLSITGTGEPNTTITLSRSGVGVLSNSIAVNGAGNWSFDYTATTLPPGNYIFTATASDVAGNTSGVSPDFDVEVDLTSTTPTITAISDDTGTSNTDGITNDQTLIFSGTAEANSTLTLSLSGTGVLSNTIPVNGSGNWSFDFTGTTLSEGNYTLTASAIDIAGNVSTPANFNFEIDLTVGQPVITTISDDNGTSNTDRITNDQTLILSGTAEVNSVVTITLLGTGVLSNSVAVNGAGNWSFDYTGTTLAPGNYTFTATATDPAGNVSTVSTDFDVTIDTTNPNPPTVTSITDDTGSSNSDEITSDQTLIITGTSDPNTIITLSRSGAGVLSNSIPVNGAGNWSFDYTGTTLAPGNYTFTAVATDIAGNNRAGVTGLDVTIDISVNAPVITSISTDSGISNSDQITNDQTLIFSGSAEPNGSVSLTLAGLGVLNSNIPVNIIGNWSFDYTATTLPEGTYNLTATATDLAGNVSATSSVFDVEIDLTPPAAPVISSINNDTGASNSDQNTSDQTIILSGSAEPNSTLTLSRTDIGVLSSSITVNGAGNWTFDYTGTVLPDGTYFFNASTTDRAGNTGATSTNFRVIIDTADPSGFTVGNVVSTGGTVRNNRWNATNNNVNITIPIASDPSLQGGNVQILGSVNGGAFTNLGPTSIISGTDLGTNKIVTISAAVFESLNSGLIDTDIVSFNATISDVAGNNITGTQSGNSLIIDQSRPNIRDNEISLDPNDAGPEIITFTLDEELELAEGATVTGFSVSSGPIASAIYSSKGALNLVTLTAAANGLWNQSSTVDYVEATGNVLDLSGNELAGFVGSPVEINVVNLTAGDIAFTSYRADNPDAFSFVLMKDVIINTEINFTDNGFRSNGAFTNNSSDFTITWIADENMFAGTEILITGLNSSRGTINGSTGLSLSTGGDQILAYQGSNSQPTFLTAINYDETDWRNTLNDDNSNRSIVPTGLVDGVTAIHMLEDDRDNGAYDFANEITSGSVSTLFSSLIDNTNWDQNDNPSNVDFPSLTPTDENYILPPNVEATIPANGGRIAADFSNFQIDFDEVVAKSAVFGGEISFVESGGGVVSTFDLSDTEISVNNDVVNIDISSVLPLLTDETTYEVNVDGFLFVNVDGNHNDSIVGSTEWSFTYDSTPPQVTSIVRSSGSTNPAIDDNGVVFTVTFDDNVTGVDINDFALTGTASTIANIATVNTISASTYNIEIDGIDLDNNRFSGLLGLNLIDNNSIIDNAGNPLGGNGVQNFTSGESFVIIHPVPAEHVSSFRVDAVTATSIQLAWTESLVEQLPNRYLITVRDASSSFITVTDGLQFNDTDFSDGQGALNVNRGVNTVQITGLNSGTEYFFQIIPHTNDGTNTFYRTAATIPVTNGTTLVAAETTISFVSAVDSIVATVNDQASTATLLPNLSFSITDDGGVIPDPDNAPTLIDQVIFTQGTNNDPALVDWTNVIAGAQLEDSDNNTITGTVSASAITFNLPNADEEIGEIDDNETKTYELKIWLNSNVGPLRDIIDGLQLEFVTNEANITVAASGSSNISASATVNSGVGNNEIEVLASQFIFTDSPAAIEGTSQLLNQVAAVEVRDDNNNLDLDYTGSFQLSTPEANFSNPTDDFSGDGILSFTDFQYRTTGNGMVTISDPASILSSATSSAVDVINTVFIRSVTGLSPSQLEAGDGDQAIFGFGVTTTTNTAGQPVLPGFSIQFDRDFSNSFENFRVFSSIDNSFSLLDDNVITGLTISQNVNNLDISGLNQTLLNGQTNYFFLVVDVSSDVSRFDPPIQPSMTRANIPIPSSSGSVSNFNFTGTSYTFNDQRPPAVVALIPEGNNAPIDTDLSIVFDEDVQTDGTPLTLFTVNDGQEAGEATLISPPGFSNTLTYEFQGTFEEDREYYVIVPSGIIEDESGNAFGGIQSDTEWRFRIADSEPPVFIDGTPTGSFVFSEGFDIRVNMDEIGTAHYLIFGPSGPAAGEDPTVDELIDGNYNGIEIPVAQGVIDVTQFESNYFAAISGLSINTTYNVFIAARDEANNRQTSVTSFSISTLSSQPSGIQLSNPTIEVCAGSFQEISEPIHIMEGSGSNGDFSSGNDQTIDIALPTGYTFYTGTDTPPRVDYFTSGDISTPPTIDVINAGLARITFSVNGGNNGIDRITIRDLRIQAAADAAFGDLVKFSGSFSDLNDNTTLAQFNLAAEIPALFSFGSGADAIALGDTVSLRPDPTIFDSGTNEFSGNGVQGNLFFSELAGLGTEPITLVHTTEFGCVSTNTRNITVFDDAEIIAGLESNYCTDDLPISIRLRGPSNQTIGTDVFNLVELEVDSVNNNVDESRISITDISSDSLEIIFDEGIGNGQVIFAAIFVNRSDPSDSLRRSRVVNISNPPELSLLPSNNFGPTTDSLNYCQGLGNIAFQGRLQDQSRDFAFEQIIEIDINGDGIGDPLTPNPIIINETDANGIDFVIDTDSLAIIPNIFNQPVDILYTVNNQGTTCGTTTSYRIILREQPTAEFLTELGCIDRDLTFVNTSQVTDGVRPIDGYQWEFDDELRSGSNEFQPTFVYGNTGTFDVSLSVTSVHECPSEPFIRPVSIGDNPELSFSYEQIGIDNPTMFNASIDNVPLNQVDSVIWVFDQVGSTTPDSLVFRADFESDLFFQFDNNGIHQLDVRVVTLNGCVDVINDSVFTVDVVEVTPEQNYIAQFEDNDTIDWVGWGINSSWARGESGGNIITEGFEGNGDNFWVTGEGTAYNQDEESFLYSPIFDLSSLERPLIALNTFNHIFPGNDGAVIQYSTNGLFGDWRILGSLGSGIEWYNAENILNAPGDQIVDLVGWSAADDTWRESRNALNDENGILNAPRIQFRIAFKSGDLANEPFDGFALDNFRISERSRIVLIENFTNTSSTSAEIRAQSDFLRDLLSNSNDNTEFVNINYHTDFPGPDPFNNFNPADPSARAVFYNITEVPSTLVDGSPSQSNPFSDGGLSQLQLRSLIEAPFEIDLNLSPSTDGALNIAIDVDRTLANVDSVFIFVAILEREVTIEQLENRGVDLTSNPIRSGENVFNYTLRQILPNAAGFSAIFSDSNPSENISFSWKPSSINPDSISVIVFIQDQKGSREVYQSEIADIDFELNTVTSIENLLDEGISIFPNPANDLVSISLGENTSDLVLIRIYDNYGKLVSNKTIEVGQSKIDLDVENYTPGLYHIQLSSGDSFSLTKRLMIVH